jgi:hypothetical protein
MERSPFSFSGLLSRLLYHFNYGDTPSSPLDYPNVENPRLERVPFPLHPGPLREAISNAKELHKPLLLYVFCLDNPDCAEVDLLFQSPAVVQEISTKFVFFAASSTTADGWSIITGTKFKRLPLIIFVRPTGDALSHGQVFLNHQGEISEEVLLSSMAAVAAPPGDPLRAAQEREFQEALDEEQRRAAATAAESDARARVDREFAELAQLQPGEADGCPVKFHFPDSSQRVFVFPPQAPVALMFRYVRYFLFPREFALETGFPRSRVADDDGTIERALGGRYVQVYVIEVDE